MIFVPLAVLYRWGTYYDTDNGNFVSALSERNDGTSVLAFPHLDRHMRPQLLPSARQLAHELFQFGVHEFPRFARYSCTLASFVSEYVA